MKDRRITVFLLFLAQILLSLRGTDIFQKEANPFALLLVSILVIWYSLQTFSPPKAQQSTNPPNTRLWLWAHGFLGMFGIATAYEELRKIWVKYPAPGKISDVLPQLEGQCTRFFSGHTPYERISEIGHQPYPVYMPLHWSPIQISHVLNLDIRWSAMIMLFLATGITCYWLAKSHPNTLSIKYFPLSLIFAIPVWSFALWGKIDIAVSFEGVVAAWYLLLAGGLAAKNTPLIAIGLAGALLSRYTLLFWTFPFATLIWLHAPKKQFYWISGVAAAACLSLFVLPFWSKDPGLVANILAYYNGCSEGSWLRPDEYTFKEGLSLNIHLRHWLPGNPEDNLWMRNLPQVIVQLIIGALAVYFYEKKWRNNIDVYTYSLVLLLLMVICMYSFSPMLFRYYMLMPIGLTAVLTWKVLGTPTAHKIKK